MTAADRAFEVLSGDLHLEGVLRTGEGDLAALVLHPHPQYGGDMHNHVVTAVADTLAARGATTLRLNFRGAGRSEGSYDEGRGEAADALAAIAALRKEAPEARIVLCGYSFGAMIAAAVAEEVALAGLILVSPPVGSAALPPLTADLSTLLITGSRDGVAPADRVRALAGGAVQAGVIEGADHGWWPGLDSLVDEVERFANSLTTAG